MAGKPWKYHKCECGNCRTCNARETSRIYYQNHKLEILAKIKIYHRNRLLYIPPMKKYDWDRT